MQLLKGAIRCDYSTFYPVSLLTTSMLNIVDSHVGRGKGYSVFLFASPLLDVFLFGIFCRFNVSDLSTVRTQKITSGEYLLDKSIIGSFLYQ